jgi:hypothetical protein
MAEAPSVRFDPKKEPSPNDGIASAPEANARVMKACMMNVKDARSVLLDPKAKKTGSGCYIPRSYT